MLLMVLVCITRKSVLETYSYEFALLKHRILYINLLSGAYAFERKVMGYKIKKEDFEDEINNKKSAFISAYNHYAHEYICGCFNSCKCI